MAAMAKPIVNFGGNISFLPQFHEEPRDEAELFEVLRRHAGRKVRVYASLHAWNRVAVCDEVAINLRRLNTVHIRTDVESPSVVVGGGCTIDRLLGELNQQGWTLPSVGLITQQTVAGATSTGTHGSGRHSLSHYIQSARIATYDASGKPVIREVDSGAELLAARCGLGSLGVALSVELPIRKQYHVEEHFCRYDSLDAVLAAENEFPIQQFFLVPWHGGFFAQHRREVDAPRSRLAGLYRLYWALGMDRGLHLLILALARLLPDRCTPIVFRHVIPSLVPRNWRVVDRSDRQLTMRHHLFRHIETEMFVTRSRLPEMIEFTNWLLAFAAGEAARDDGRWTAAIDAAGLSEECDRLASRYRHHYPICIRKVLPDDTLVSMASGGDEPWYAVSFISYGHADRRDGFFQCADLLVRLTGELFDARPHWGKYCQLPIPQVERLYPRLPEFCEIRRQFDPAEAFRPEWL
jgi:FAD/FMN-containing dehydrogenase